MKKFRFLVISDGHGDYEKLDKLDEEFKKADAVLFGGDFAKFQEPDTGLPFLQRLMKKHDLIYAVLGNCDSPDFIDNIEENDISVEKSMAFHEGLAFLGSGGGSKFTGTTLFERTDEELVSDLSIVTEQEATNWNNLVAIMHNPPKDTKTDTISNGIHVGSQGLREWIETYKPLLVVTGHIHESAGIDKIGETVVINPGALCDGKYGIVEVEKDGEEWKVTSSQLKEI